MVSVNSSKSYGCTQSALNDHHISITWYAHRLSQLSLFLNEWEMHTWFPNHVEIPAEHPLVYPNYAWSNFFHSCNYIIKPTSRWTKYSKDIGSLWQYANTDAITLYMQMLGASACIRSLRLFTCVQYNQLATPRRHVAYNVSFWMKWSVFMLMTGMGNPFLTTVNKLITLDTRGACISCVLLPNLWSWPSHPQGLPIPVIISWKHFHFIQKPIGCRLHASSWWPVDFIAHMWTVSNFWRKLKHISFTCI